MPIYSHLKKSGGSLIALVLMQGQMAIAAEIAPPGSSSASQQAVDVIAGESSPNTAEGRAGEAISAIEKRYFEHDFRSESLDERLTRVEQLILAKQS